MEKTNKNAGSQKKYLLWGGIALFIVVLFGAIAISKNIGDKSKFFKVGDHEISKLEYTYYFANNYSTFVNTYGSYVSYFGLDTSKSLESQTYSGERTWNDYFMEQAVNGIQNVYAMYDAAIKDEGFDADVKSELDENIAELKDSLKDSEYNLSGYLKATYGDSMNEKYYKEFVTRQLVANKYYNYLKDQYVPTEEELEKEYDENKSAYSLTAFKAEKKAYTYENDASDKEKEAAKEAAKKEAEEQLKDMSKVELIENYNISSLTSVLKNWLLEEGRKAGDTAVLEDTSNKCYYAVEFVSMVKNEKGTVDFHQIQFSTTNSSAETAHKKAQMTLDFWKESNTGKDGFVELVNKVSDDKSTENGLHENVYYGYMLADINEWLFDDERKEGDTIIIDSDSASHILYFDSRDDEAYWIYAAKDAIKSAIASDKQSELAEAMEIKDEDGNLTYLNRKTQAELTATDTDATKTDAEKK